MYDVAVLGGGPAGIAAALAAARGGARTALIERYGFLGGMSTAALVYPWMTFHTESGRQVIRGIAQEIVDRLIGLGASPGHLRDTIGFTYSLTPFDPEVYKVVAHEMLKEAGVHLLLHTWADDVVTRCGRIEQVLLHNKSGSMALRAKMYVDATGDGDIAYLAGAPWEQGNREGRVQPMTMKFRMRGVNVEEIRDYMKKHPEEFYERSLISELDRLPLTGVMGFYSIWKRASLPIAREGLLFFIGPRGDEALINVSRVSGLDPTRAEQLTEAELEGRRQALMLERFFRESVPGFRHAALAQVGAQIGVRETRRIRGQYMLNGEDVLSGRRFDDCIARSGYPIDIHNPSGGGVTTGMIRSGGAYDIPYRSIVPLGVENLLLAGRCISATHEAQATARLTPSCMAVGQAAGAAAAIAARTGCAAAEVPIESLRQKLLSGGAELGLDEKEEDHR